MMFVMGLAAYAAAEVTISGDARVRGIYLNNADADDKAPDLERYYDQRVRLNIDGKNDDEAAVKVRITAGEGYWDGGSQTKGGCVAGESAAGTALNHTDNCDSLATGGLKIDEDDYAYISVPFGDIKVDAGLQPADWGNKFMAWGKSQERIKVYTKINEMTVGAFTQKSDEAPAPTEDTAKDVDGYAAYVVAPMGDLKVGAIAIYAKDKPKDMTGTTIDAFLSGKTGEINLAGEIVYKTGDLNKTVDKDGGENSPMGFFIHADMQMDALNVGGAVAMTKNGYVANKYFTPTAFFGTSQPTALADFGDFGPAEPDTTAIVVAVSSKISDAMTAGAKVAYAQMKEYDMAMDDAPKITEIDATFTYAIGENTKYNLVAAYGMPKNFSTYMTGTTNDDPITAAMHEITVTF